MNRYIGPLVAGVLFGTVIGAVVGWTVFSTAPIGDAVANAASRSNSRGGARETNGSSDDAASRTTGAAPASAAPVTAERTSGVIPASSSVPAEVFDRVSAFVKTAPQPVAQRGLKTVRGAVTDSKGQPLAGAIVRAQREDDDSRHPYVSQAGHGAPPPPSLEKSVRDAVEAYYARESEFREVTTGSDGHYTIADLREGRWTVQAWCEGYSLSASNGSSEVRPDAVVDFSARPIVRVPVAVLLPNGEKAPTAAIAIREKGNDNDRDTQCWVATEPTIAVEPGDRELRATLGDPQQGPNWPDFLTSEKVDVHAEIGAAPTLVTIQLKGSPGIRGRLQKADGTMIPYAQVKMAQLAPGETPDLKHLGEQGDDFSFSDNWVQNGEYVFRDLKPGRYVVGASRDWRGRIVASAIVEVRDSMIVQDLVIPPLDTSTCISVKVTGPDEEIVNDVNFQFRIQRDKGNSSMGVVAERQQPGLWWLSLDAERDDFNLLKPWAPGMRVHLVASTQELGSTSVEIRPGTRTVDLKFSPPARVVVTVPGYVGSPYCGRVQVGLQRTDEDNRHFGWGGGGGQEVDKETGMAKLGPVEAGRWKLMMWIQSTGNQRWDRSEAASIDVNLAAGDNQASITIPTLYPLAIHVPDSTEGRVQMQGVGKTSQRYRWAEIDKQGNANFSDLLPGDYRLTLSGGATQGVMTVHVPAGGPVEFVSQAVNALRVIVEDGAAALGTAGFRDGDLVVAIEGKEFASVIDWQFLMNAVRQKKSGTFTVQRGADKVDLTLESKLLNDAQKLGGSLEPATK